VSGRLGAEAAALLACRRKTQDLQAAGCRAIRVTARQLDAEPLRIAAILAAALAAQ